MPRPTKTQLRAETGAAIRDWRRIVRGLERTLAGEQAAEIAGDPGQHCAHVEAYYQGRLNLARHALRERVKFAKRLVLLRRPKRGKRTAISDSPDGEA